jgi:predicted amidohydrolase YtcJ
VLFAALVLVECTEGAPPADLVFTGGPVRTMDAAGSVAEAVAVRGDRIVYVGDEAGVAELVGPGTRVVDLNGRLLLPGFVDTHVHPASGGIEAAECDLNGSASRAEVIERVARCASESPESPWIRGGGFDLPYFPDGAPSRELLDSLVPNRPAFLTSADAHTAWVNTRALTMAGVTAETPDPPPDGVIVRTASGDPQGTLRESAMDLVARHMPPHTPEEVEAGLRRGLARAASFGITTLHEANATEAYAAAYRSLDEAGELTARAIIALDVDEDRGPSQIPELMAIRQRTSSARALPVAAKIFLDGVIEGGTAAVLEPYLDRTGWRGELNVPPDTLDALVAALDDAGFKVHIHAIGDRAIRAALDALEAQRERDGGAGPRHILAHIQLIDPVDIPRFATTGAVASFQPLWFYADTYITDLTEPRLGQERSRWLYPARSVQETGAIVAAGSDWSVSSMDPLVAIETGITRRDPAESASGGPPWIPEETLDLEAMVAAYTRQGAVASDLEEDIGTIEVGKSADLVVLDTDLFEIEPTLISEAHADMTVFEGRVVYERGVPSG